MAFKSGFLPKNDAIKMNIRQLRYLSCSGTIIATAFLTLFIEHVALFV